MFFLSRRKAREMAFKMLYAIHEGGNSIDEAAEIVLSKNLDKEQYDFVFKEVRGTIDNINVIDNIIQKYSSAWSLDRISSTDRNILRLAIYEILFCDDIPNSVSINEAVDMSKKYCDEKSYKYINGLLGRVIKEETGNRFRGEKIGTGFLRQRSNSDNKKHDRIQ
ncbi:MAG: transcription antitermination factor NusB [Tepidanaerobacteraceae bacterium]|nr:transcription antitermination factor NusB [Tepidanaerobacteraceae bacterium]